jgi:PAS domain S-box-containing protein
MKSKTSAKSKVISKLEKVYKLIENVDNKGKEKLREELNNLISSLEQNEYNLQKLQENVPAGLYQTTPQGEFTFVNSWFAKILGYKSPAELLNKKVADIYADPKKRKEIVLLLNKQGRIKDTEVLIKRKDGSKIWVIISAKTEYDSEKKAHCYDGYIYDISERKKVVGQLRESEEMFRGISHNLKSALFIYNEKGEFIYLNPASFKITGYPKNELLGMKFFDIIHPDYRGKIKERGFQRVTGSDVPNNYTVKIITKSGKEKWLEISAVQLDIQDQSVVMGLGNDITDQIETLELSRKNEEKYKSLYSFFRLMADNVPDMIWSKDLDGNYIFVNKGICEKLLMAKNTNEPIGKSEQFFKTRERKKRPNDPEWFTFGEKNIDSDKVVKDTKKPQRFQEYGNVKGQFQQLDVYKAPLLDEHGKIIGIVCSARDVTREMQITKEKEQVEKLKNLVYKISNAVNTTKDINELFTVIRLELSNIIDTSNLFIALYDKDKDEITLPYFVDQKDRFVRFPAKKSLTHYLIRQNKPLLLKEKDYKKLLEENEIEIVGTPAKIWLGVPLNINDETIGAIVIQNYLKEDAFDEKDMELLRFISNQISISISQKQADDVVRESEYRLRQIIDTVPHMIYLKDKHGRFILANKATADAYGLRVDEIEGCVQTEIHKDINERKLYAEDDNYVLNSGKINIRQEEKFTDHQGQVRFMQTIKIPLHTEVDNGEALLGVAIDITSHRNAEIELKLAKEKAEESDRLKTAFLANMSHEIRTPMNAIIGFSELLNDQDITVENRKEFVQLISDNSKVLLNLIEAVIDVAKIEAEQIKIVHSTCEVNQIIDELAEFYRNETKKFTQKNIEIKTAKAIDDDQFAIVTDPLRFKQIMSNLMANAIKFTERGIVELGYELKNNHLLQFYVKDSGIGLPPDKLNLIFERFRQAEESSTKEYGGTGLGLTISRKLVELLGGEIWVESEMNKGSTFRFTLPIKMTKGALKTKPFENLSDKHDWSGKIILVAEDEKSNFDLVKAILLKTKAIIKWVKNGKEAVDFCMKNDQIDLVLMDIRMPEMNGYEATKKIKVFKPDLPIMSLTAYALAEDQEQSVTSGCDDHISKPIKPLELIDKMSRYLK